ncbi:MAG: hypothetical protein LV481_06940 [Methylacidiphilales bacterium]|nr:hypothetical protein [Candidatus Methylacidiphilales bacterium]
MSFLRSFIAGLICLTATVPSLAQNPDHRMIRADDAKLKEMEAIWEKHILDDARNRYCDKAMGEEIGWLMAPFLQGFYYGYLANGDTKWVDEEVDWLDSWIKREVIEPDGYPGWPKFGAAGTDVDQLNGYDADSLLGEAMVLRSAVLISNAILKSPSLTAKYGAKAQGYLRLSELIYEKWDKRGAWRDTEGGGTISVVLPFGIDPKSGKWTGGYETRNDPGEGFSHPENKANLTACWLLAMFDATQNTVYRDRAERWFKLMKSRMKLNENGTYDIWDYWQPAGPWDYKPDGAPKHWIGVHPNGGYYEIDLAAIVEAYQHGLVFDKNDIDRLIATAKVEKRYWEALVPYDDTIQQQFESHLKPDSWGGLASTPRYLLQQAQLRQAP